MRTFFHTKLHTKKTWICVFAAMMLVVCLSAAVMCTHTAFAGNKQSLADAVKSDVYRELANASMYLQSEDWVGACDMLMDAIDAQCEEDSFQLSSDQRLQVKDTLKELVISLSDHGMITFDPNGNLTELSKAYLSNAASYALTSVTGTGEVAISSTVLSDLISTEAIDTAVTKMKTTYMQSIDQFAGDGQSLTDLSDIQTQLDALKKGLKARDSELVEASQIALRVDALETMVSTLKNSPVLIDGNSEGTDGTTAKLAALESGLDAMKEAVSSADEGKTLDEVSRLSDDVASLSKELAELKQSDIDTSFGKLSHEISAREAAIASLRDELNTMEQANTTMTTSLQDSVSGLSDSLSSMQTSLGEVRSEQQTTLNTWKTGVNGTLAVMQSEIRTLSETDEANVTSLASLSRSIDDVKAAVSDNEQRQSEELRLMEKNLQTQINDTRQSLTEQLSSTKNQLLSRFNALDLTLSNAIDEEVIARSTSDAAIQEQIHSTANTSLEKQAEEIQGDSVFAKLGSLLKKITSLNTYIDTSVSGEAAARESATQKLQQDLDEKVTDINFAMNNLQRELASTDSDNASAILAAKRELVQALDALDLSLSGDLSDLEGRTQEDIEAVRQSVTRLQESLKDSDEGLTTDLEETRDEFTGQLSETKDQLFENIFQLEIAFDEEMNVEETAREEADAALQAQIRSETENELEHAAGEIEGTTIFEKLGTLLRKLLALGTHVDQSVAEESRAREEAVRNLQEDIGSKAEDIQIAMNELQDVLSRADAEQTAALNQTKSDLEAALSQMETTLSTDISDLDASTKEQITSVMDTITSLQNTLQNADAALAQDLDSTKNQLSLALNTAKTQLSDQISSLDSAISSSIAVEKQERADADRSLLERIHSTANTLLEQKAGEITGETVFEKLGSLLKSFTIFSEHTDQAIADEISERKTATQNLQKDINDKVEAVDQAMQELQAQLAQADADNAVAIAQAKSSLETALDALGRSLSSDISALDTKTQEQIADIRGTITTLRTDLEIADRNLARDLTSARSTLSGQISSAQSTLSSQISTLDNSLNQTVDAEIQAREAADNTLKEQIQSSSNTDLEKKAGEITGSTVFEKLGTLFQQFNALKKTDEWAQNITLSHTASSGTKIYGILNSSDSLHEGWKMWKLDGASLGVTFHAAGDSSPESEVFVTYVGNEGLIMEYQIKEGYLIIYTPTAPSADIAISSIHVQNQIAVP